MKDTIKAIQDDKGGKFMPREFDAHCDKRGIVHNRAQQNGSAENGNKVVGERIISLLSEANLPMQFWAEALAALTNVWNHCPTSALKGTWWSGPLLCMACMSQPWFLFQFKKRRTCMGHVQYIWDITGISC